MRKGLLKKLLVGTLSTIVIAVSFPIDVGFETKADDFRDLGYHDGLDWELWYRNGSNNEQGKGEMKQTGNGGFIAEWDNIEDYMARTGIKWELEYDYDEHYLKYYNWNSKGDIVVNFDVDYRPDGCSSLGVYGNGDFEREFEFYIMENYQEWNPADSPETFEFIDTIKVDGITYNVYRTEIYDISGIIYRKYFSVRCNDDKSSSGVVNVTKHLEEWQKLGLYVPYSIREASLYVDGFNSSGYAEVKKNFITLGGVPVNDNVSVDFSDKPHNRGDISNDGIIDVFDVILMRKAITESMTSQYNCKAADIDGNGKIAVNDIVLLSKYVLGKSKSLPDVVTTNATTTVKTTINPEVTTTAVTKPNLPLKPDEDGVLLRESFENGMNYFINGTNAEIVSDEHFLGEKSLFISGKDISSPRTVEIDVSDIFVPGVDYEVKAVVKQKNKRKAFVDWELNYTDSDGNEAVEYYSNSYILYEVFKNDVWGELRSRHINIDESWSNCKLVITNYTENTDFYVDDILISEISSEDKPVVEPSEEYERNDKYQPIEYGEFLTDYIDGYEYEYYLEDDKGTCGIFPINDGGLLSVYWQDADNYRCTIRKRMPSYIESPSEIENLYIDFNAKFQFIGESCFGVHGWTQDELAEYYIIENYSINSLFDNLEFVDKIDIDGVEYDVYKGMKTNQPSIEGIKTYPVYYSVRCDGEMNRSDTIDYFNKIIILKKHFYKWKKLGLVLGEKLYDVSLFAEGKNFASGRGEMSIREVYFSEFTSNPDIDPDFEYKYDPGFTPDENGYLINESFENGVGYFRSTINAVGRLDSSASYSGDTSFKLTNRREDSSYIYLRLGSTNFEPGKQLDISAMVMQDEFDYEALNFEIQYSLRNELPCMSNSVKFEKVIAPKGEWVELSNLNFTVPEDAYDLKLKIICDNTKHSFYIDDVKVALVE